MKHLKTFENLADDILRQNGVDVDKLRKKEIDTKEQKKKLTKDIIKKIVKFVETVYPECEIKIKKKDGLYSFDKEYKIDIHNIRKIIPERMSDELDWLQVERSSWDITFHFPIRYNEKSFLPDINKYLMPIIKQYQTNNDHKWIFCVEYKDIEKIIDEISIEEFRIHQQADKYNL